MAALVLNTFNNNYWDKYEGYDLNSDGTGDVPLPPREHVFHHSRAEPQQPPPPAQLYRVPAG